MAALLAALLAGAAVLCAMPRPMAGLAPRRTLPGAPGWSRARPGALGLRPRMGIAVLLALAGWLMVPPPWAAPCAVLLLATTPWALGRLQPGDLQKARSRVVLELPETLDLLAAALEAGAPLRLAAGQVAQLGPASTASSLRGVCARIGVGMDDASAWLSLADDPDWGQVARDVARSAETGTAAARVLRQHAADARTRRHDELLKRARAVGVRSTLPLMCCFLPAFILTGVVPIVASLVGTYLHR